MSRRYRTTLLVLAALFIAGLAITQPSATDCVEHPRLCTD